MDAPPSDSQYGVAVAVFLLLSLRGNWNDTSTGIKSRPASPFSRLLRIRSRRSTFNSRFARNIRWDHASPSREQFRTRSAAAWHGKVGETMGSTPLWTGRSPGIAPTSMVTAPSDYVLFGYGPYGNGRTTPPFSISILLMDRDGLPVPFFNVVYQGENGAGVKHLVDLNGDGKAELLISTYDELSSDERVGPFCSGALDHTTLPVQRFRSPGIPRIDQQHPLSVSSTIGPTGARDARKRSLVRTLNRRSFMNTAPPRRESCSQRFAKWKRGPGSLPSIPVMADVKPVDPRVVVYDRPQLREIAFPNPYNSYPVDLETTLMRNGARSRTARSKRAIGRLLHGKSNLG